MSDLTRLHGKIVSSIGWMRPYLEVESELAALVQSEVSAEKFEAQALEAAKRLERAKIDYLKVEAEIELTKRAAAADAERVAAERAKGAEAVDAMYKQRQADQAAAYDAKQAEVKAKIDASLVAVEELRAAKEHLEAEVAQLTVVRDSLRQQLTPLGS